MASARVPAINVVRTTRAARILLEASRNYLSRTSPFILWIFWHCFTSWFHIGRGQILMLPQPQPDPHSTWVIAPPLSGDGWMDESTSSPYEPYQGSAIPCSGSGVPAFLHERADTIPYSQGLHEARHRFVAHVLLLHLLLENTADSSACSNTFKGCSGVLPGLLNTKQNPLRTHKTCKEAESRRTEHHRELCAAGLQLHQSHASTIHLTLDDFQRWFTPLVHQLKKPV